MPDGRSGLRYDFADARLFRTFCHCIVKAGWVRRTARITSCIRISQPARHQGKRIELLGCGRCRQQQKKNQVNRPLIDGIELDGTLQSSENSERRFHVCNPCMRDRHAAAQARGSQLLTFEDSDRDFISIDFKDGGGTPCRGPPIIGACLKSECRQIRRRVRGNPKFSLPILSRARAVDSRCRFP